MNKFLKQNAPFLALGFLIAIVSGLLLLASSSQEPEVRDILQTGGDSQIEGNSSAVGSGEPSARLVGQFPDADLKQSIIDLELVLSGGPERDGIPALTNPQFDPLSTSTDPGETLGIFLEDGDDKRFYPYTVLVWHEIVNDTIGDTDVAVTFCPLCGSAIVFDRNVSGEVREFGVSGFLYESNMLMFDRSETPSLWSQARAEAVVGDEIGQTLDIVDFQLLTLDDVRALHHDAVVLSENTGFSRNYGFDPYSGYEDTEDTIFPVSVDDSRFPAKELFFIAPTEEASVAIQIGNVGRGQTLENTELGLSVEKTAGGEVIVTSEGGETLPGYYEMWFSWTQHHQDGGEVWAI